MRAVTYISIAAVATALLGLSPQPCQAQAAPISLPGDPRLVVFMFDENNSYPILTRIKSATTIALQKGESVEGMILGDTFSWEVEAVGANVFVKPKFDNVTTSAALVTNRRTYQFTLKSTTETGRWYQRVSFEYPQESMLRRPDARAVAPQPVTLSAGAEVSATPAAAPDKAPRGPAPLPATGTSSASDGPALVDLQKLNFRYAISGDAPFRPIKVFDDGASTWVQMPPKLQEQPALFVLNEAGQAELVQWFPRGDYLEVKRTGKNLLLKLGSREVRVTNERDRSRWDLLGSGSQ